MTITADLLRGNWNYPTTVRFGPGRIGELAQTCRDLGIARPMLVTDRGLAALDMVRKIVASTEADGIPMTVYSEVQPDPVWKNVSDGIDAFRAGRHDGVIALGGGSPLDVGKTIAFMLPQTRPIWDFEDIGDNFKRAVSEGIPPIIAVPTTAGTGSEVGRATVITDADTHTKRIIFHPKMLPAVAILDPELTIGMSPKMTAGTGFDALAHNLEAYCAVGFHPMADGIGAEGVRLVHDHLITAYKDGANLLARSYMLAAAAMGATAFQKGLGAVHSLSHPVGALYHIHHGLTNAVFLPYVLAFNRPAIEPKIARLAATLGLPNPSFDSFQSWLLDLRRQTDIPHTIAALGVEESRLVQMSEMALVDPSTGGNPVTLTAANLLALYRAAMIGDL